MSNKNVIRVKWIIKWGETSIFIYNRFGSVLFGSVRLEYLSFGIRYFGILPDSVVHCPPWGPKKIDPPPSAPTQNNVWLHWFFLCLKVSRISSKTKLKENNNPNPNESPPSPTFEPVFPQVQDSGFSSVQEEEEENIVDNLLLKKFKKSNGQEINMLTTWYNEALDVKVFRCFICNREVRGTQDLLTHLKGSRHQEYMKKIENLEINCHICSAKVKEKKLKEHIKNCEKIETEGIVLKSRKQCQLCDKVFKTLPEAFYHVKTGHFQIKEEKIQTGKKYAYIILLQSTLPFYQILSSIITSYLWK